MNTTTWPPMAKKLQSSDSQGSKPERMVRLAGDVAELAKEVARLRATSIADLLSPHLREWLQIEFNAAIDDLKKRKGK